jgi:hypothetical protein
MNRLYCTAVCTAFALCVTGCAIEGSAVPSAAVTPVRVKAIPLERVKNAVTIGKSTRADVVAVLGETLVIRFDTGYEVWVYRLTEASRVLPQRSVRTSDKAWASTPPEFVILFAPSGLVAKTRIRPAPQT